MRRTLIAPFLAAAIALTVMVAPVAAITGGQPDGDGHPQTALLLAPGLTFCSGTLIDEQTILTAGHCTDFWTELAADPEVELEEILVSFDAQAAVDEDWLPVDETDWFTASEWMTHPDYVSADWPFTFDYGLLFLDEDPGITPATLAPLGTLGPILGGSGASKQLFDDVGYGVQGNIRGGGPPQQAITWTRKIAVQRYAPGNGSSTGIFHESWFILKNSPSDQHGGACGGDSGSPIFLHDTTVVAAVHTGGYRMGLGGVLCGRKSSLNHRVDIEGVHDWILANAI